MRWGSQSASDLTEIRIDAPERQDSIVTPGEPEEVRHEQWERTAGRTVSIILTVDGVARIEDRKANRCANFCTAWRRARDDSIYHQWLRAQQRRFVNGNASNDFGKMGGAIAECGGLSGN